MEDADKRKGVHRGKVNPSMTLAQVEKILKEYNLPPEVQLTGSRGGSGHRYRDVDIAAKPPWGLPRAKWETIEREIQDKTGADFYFED